MMEKTTLKYSTLAIPNQDRLLYGVSPHPLACGLGLTIGGGLVFPEVNFTLPAMNIEPGTWAEVVAHYERDGRADSAPRGLAGVCRESYWNLNFCRP